MVYPTRGFRRFRLCDGRRSRSLPASRRPPRCPIVCVDEKSQQHIKEIRVPVPMAPGMPTRYDFHYTRKGVSNLFMIFAPLLGFRHVEVTNQRRSIDFAHICRDLVDVHFSDAEKIILVCDNLNTHKPASLYKAFPSDEADRIAEKLQFCYTPKHGSWLNIAEIELSVLSRQCLCRRIGRPRDPKTRGSGVARP